MKSLQDIAAELQGYDPQALRADAVHGFLQRLIEPLGGAEGDVQQLLLGEALGRVLAQDVVSPLNVPPHDNAAMDGWAFDGRLLQEAPPGQPLWLRPAAGRTLAGALWTGDAQTLGADGCVRIMTGAPMPPGLDTVVPQELAQLQPDGRLRIEPGVLARGDNRRLAGEDLRRGEVALAAGQPLGPAALGLLASLGLQRVAVWRRARVAYLSTGDEILSLGEPPREGAVYDSNRYTITAMLRQLGCEVRDLGVVRDEPEALVRAFTEAATWADAVISSGGVSVGEADHTKSVMQRLSAGSDGAYGVLFWRVAMRPGRPLAVGRIPRPAADSSAAAASPSSSERPVLLFGLPGNPVAAMVSFLVFVRPALQRLMGSADAAAPLLWRARSAQALRKKPGRTEYQRGIVRRSAAGLEVCAIGNQGSGVLRSMVEANALIVLHHDQGPVAAGDEVDVLPLQGLV